MPPGENSIQISVSGDSFFESLFEMGVSVDNATFGFRDRVRFFAVGDTIPASLTLPAVSHVEAEISLADSRQLALSDDELPMSLTLADFDSSGIFVEATGPGGNVFTISGSILSITPLSILPGDFDGDKGRRRQRRPFLAKRSRRCDDTRRLGNRFWRRHPRRDSSRA